MTPEPLPPQAPPAPGRANGAWREGSWGHSLPHRLWYGLVALGTATLSLTLLQLLLGQRLQQAHTDQIGPEVAFNLRLGELALERYGPRDLSEISGLRLAVAPLPGARPAPRAAAVAGPATDALLRTQAERLRQNLCQRLRPAHCPRVLPASSPPRGVWVEMASPLESVWLFVPMPLWRGWPPDPRLLMLALAAGGLMAGLLYLTLEVQRPLRLLEGALATVGLEQRPGAVPARGARAVRQLTAHFNAMLERLELASQERRTMLAGMAHDLRSPLTRLRLRLGLAADSPLAAADRAQAEADLSALERITSQFLQFAGADQAEPAIIVPLDALLAEASAIAAAVALQLELQPLERRVRPTALARAVANLVENAVVHGQPPFRLVLQAVGSEDFEIQMWDGGAGIAPEQWPLALQPFQRLDQARGGQGHCGLGLAIAERVARDHGGGLSCAGAAGGFAVVLRGRSRPSA
ncbi:MAG: ATP-binding protein [Synechococcaceae cyanobacterium]|jgi:two-component system osmolarity sensor histidine kinase EnvZ|nr:ATP-binding protein [Synechococcaceae cyanobacterium]